MMTYNKINLNRLRHWLKGVENHAWPNHFHSVKLQNFFREPYLRKNLLQKKKVRRKTFR